jgi:hypothetical protein
MLPALQIDRDCMLFQQDKSIVSELIPDAAFYMYIGE